MVCPKCGFSGASGTECTECGIIFSKFFAYQERKKERARKREEQAAQEDEDLLDHYYGNVESNKPAGNLLRGYLQQYFWEPYKTPWKPTPAWQMIALSAFFVYFLFSLANEPRFRLYPAVNAGVDTFIIGVISRVNLVFHEAGHWIFGIFGIRAITSLGGSLNQVLVPFIVCMAFWRRREATGFAFALVWMFQNFLGVGIYMADARRPVLPLIGGMDSFDGGHDWINLFNWWDLWSYDTLIAKTTWTLGWIGMVCTALWFVWTWFINRSRVDEFKDDFMTGR